MIKITLIFVIFVNLFFFQNSWISSALAEKLPKSTCDRTSMEIASLFEYFASLNATKEGLVDLTNSTPEEIFLIKDNYIKLMNLSNDFFTKCTQQYTLTYGDLEKAPSGRFYFIVKESFYNPFSIFGSGPNIYSIPSLFFYLTKYSSLDQRILLYSASNYEVFEKKRRNFHKKILIGEDFKANFCLIVDDPYHQSVILGEGPLKITCPSMKLEKSFTLPIKSLKIIFPEREIVTEKRESKSVLNILFTGKYTEEYSFLAVKHNNETIRLKDSPFGPVLNITIIAKPEEVLTWLKKELSPRGFWVERKP